MKSFDFLEQGELLGDVTQIKRSLSYFRPGSHELIVAHAGEIGLKEFTGLFLSIICFIELR